LLKASLLTLLELPKGKVSKELLSDTVLAELVKPLTVNTIVCVPLDQLVRHHIQPVYSKECEWQVAWVTKE
jgi:hypothetical protein